MTAACLSNLFGEAGAGFPKGPAIQLPPADPYLVARRLAFCPVRMCGCLGQTAGTCALWPAFRLMQGPDVREDGREDGRVPAMAESFLASDTGPERAPEPSS